MQLLRDLKNMLLFKKNGVDETFRYKCLNFSIFSWENLKKEPRNILPNEAFEYLSSHLIIWTRKIVHTKYFSTWKLVHENFFCCTIKVRTFWEAQKNLCNHPYALVNIKSMMKIFSNLVCFSESLNFKWVSAG